jgi:hypothetical protein
MKKSKQRQVRFDLKIWATTTAVVPKTYTGSPYVSSNWGAVRRQQQQSTRNHPCSWLVVVAVLLLCPSTAWSGAAAVSQLGLVGVRVVGYHSEHKYKDHWGINMNIKRCLHSCVRVYQRKTTSRSKGSCPHVPAHRCTRTCPHTPTPVHTRSSHTHKKWSW